MSEEQLKRQIEKTILLLGGPYHWLDSRCYWLGMFIGDELSQRFHVWHSRLQLRLAGYSMEEFKALKRT